MVLYLEFTGVSNTGPHISVGTANSPRSNNGSRCGVYQDDGGTNNIIGLTDIYFQIDLTIN